MADSSKQQKMLPPGVRADPHIRKKRLARTSSVVGDKSVYEDDLDKFVLREYFRFLPALAHHHVVRRVAHDSTFQTSNDVHYVRDHWMATMLVDISGFTRISQEIGAEHTKKHCNAFFSRLVQVIATFRGDVLKFLGDSMLVVWPLDSHSSQFQREKACAVCVECAAALMSVGEYDAQDVSQRTKLPYPVKLRLHCGLACGATQFFCVGVIQRSEVLLGGEILKQLAGCESEAKQGEIVMSKLFKDTVKKMHWETSETRENNFILYWKGQKKPSGVGPPPKNSGTFIRRMSSFRPTFVISNIVDDEDASSSSVGDVDSEAKRNRHCEEGNARRRTLQYKMDGLERVKGYLLTCSDCEESQQKQYFAFHEAEKSTSSPTKTRRRGSLKYRFRQRTLREVRREFDAAFGKRKHSIYGNEEKKAEAVERTPNKAIRWRVRSLVHEMARDAVDNDMVGTIGDICHICTLFIRLDELIPKLASGDLAAVQGAFMTLYNTVSEAGGTLRQFAQDDKGCVGIAAFGVPGLAHSHIEDRALHCAFVLMERYKEQGLGNCGVGIATGDVFCGFVGAHHRCEWAVMGPSVNLSARLMSKTKAGQCLMDNETFAKLKESSDEFRFDSLRPVVAKGYAKPVPVHCPSRVSGVEKGEIGKDTPLSPKKVYKKRKLGRINSTTDLIPMAEIQRIKSLATYDLMVLKLASVAAHGQVNDVGWVDLRMLSYALRAVGHQDLFRLVEALDQLTSDPMLLTALTASSSVRVCGFGGEGAPQVVETALSRHMLFRQLNAASVQVIAQSMTLVELEADETLFLFGDDSKDFYVVESGYLLVTIDNHAVSRVRAGEHFGDVAILFESKRTATICAGSQSCRLWKLCAKDFRGWCSNLVFKFVSNPVRKSVYGQILKKHRKRYHGVIARYLMLQQNRRKIERRLSEGKSDSGNSGSGATSGEKSINNAGALKSTICQHMHLSNVSLISKVSQLKNYAKFVADMGKHDDAVDWYSRLVVLALGLNEEWCREVVEIFYVHEESETSSIAGGGSSKVAPQHSSRFGSHPIQLELLDDAHLRAVMPEEMSAFVAVVSQTMSSMEPVKGSALLLASWLLEIARSYVQLGQSIVAFNISQVVLSYLDSTVVPVNLSPFLSCCTRFVYPGLADISLKKTVEAQLKRRPSPWVNLAFRAYKLAVKILRNDSVASGKRLKRIRASANVLLKAASTERQSRRHHSTLPKRALEEAPRLARD